MPAGRIDVHHHLIPPSYAAAMQRKGVSMVAGARLPAWSPEISLETMDHNAIGTALLSVSSPGVYFDSASEARDLARACNDYAAEIRHQHPTRFGSFAILPMPFTDLACAEAIHALDTLKADGIVLLGSADGYFLGDERFDELMAVLNERAAIVFLHPNLHPTTDTLRLKTPGFIVEFLCDTTRAAVNLILSGTLERFPRIRWILAHAGGFLPYIAWRVSLANAMPETNAHVPQGVLTYMSQFYFDTALSPSPYAMAALQALVDPSHILFGSDFPFAPAILAALQCKTLDEAAFFTPDVKSAVMRGNALRLFPRLASQDEIVIPAPVYRGQPLAKKIRHRLARPALALVERMRNR